MQTEIIRFDDAHHLGEPATRPLSGWRSRLARRDDESCRGMARRSNAARRLLHPALGRVQLLFQGLNGTLEIVTVALPLTC